MEAISIILILTGIVFIVLAIISAIKKDTKKGFIRIGIAIVAVIVGFVFMTNSETAKEVDKKQQAEQQAKEDQAKKAKAKKDEATNKKIEALEDDIQSDIVEQSEGVIQKVTVKTDDSLLLIGVHVNEDSWAVSSESEKKSFTASISKRIQQKVKIRDFDDDLAPWVDFYSYQNGDTLASKKTFGSGFDIKR